MNKDFSDEIIEDIFKTSTEEELIDLFNMLFLKHSYIKQDFKDKKNFETLENIIPFTIEHKYYDLTYLIVLYTSIKLIEEEIFDEAITLLNKYIIIMKENNLLVNEAKLLTPLFPSYINTDNMEKVKETTNRFENLYSLIENPDEELRFQYTSMMNF